MPTKKKTTKKYSLSRSVIEERLQLIEDALNEIDVHDVSPNDLTDTLSTITSDVQDLRYEVTEEAD